MGLSTKSEMTAPEIDDGVKPIKRPASNPQQSGNYPSSFSRGAEQRREKNLKELPRPSVACPTLPLSPRAVYPFTRFAGAERTALRKASWLNSLRRKGVAGRSSASSPVGSSTPLYVFPIIPSDYGTYPSWSAILRVKRKRRSRWNHRDDTTMCGSINQTTKEERRAAPSTMVGVRDEDEEPL